MTLGSSMQGAVFGLDIAIGRVWNLMGKLTSVPIMEGTGSWTWTIWVRFLFLFFSPSLLALPSSLPPFLSPSLLLTLSLHSARLSSFASVRASSSCP